MLQCTACKDCFILNFADTFFLDDFCTPVSTNQEIPANKSVWLHTNRKRTYGNDVDCSLTFYTAQDYKLEVRTHVVSLGQYDDCLTLYDSSWRDPDASTANICNKYDTLAFETSQRYLTVRFKLDGQLNGTGVTLVITSTADGKRFVFLFTITILLCHS